MSDSPLDGGSGWPTSAYQIVPRQAAQERPASSAPPAPPGAADPAAPGEEFAPSRKGRIAALAIGLVVLIIAVVGGVLATRDYQARKDADATAVTTPTAEAATGVPADDPSAPAGGLGGGSGAGGAGASGAASTPAGPPATGILRAGTAKLAVVAGQPDDAFDFDRLPVVAGQPDDAFDFDSGLKQTSGADATAGTLGVSAANGARFAVLTTSDTPSLAACSAVPAGQWVSQVLLAALVPGTKVCIRTSEDRYAWFMTRAGEVVNGAIFTANLDYIVYKKSGD